MAGRFAAYRDGLRDDVFQAARAAAGLDAQRLDHDRGVRIGIAEALAMQSPECDIHFSSFPAGHLENAVAARKAQPCAAFDGDGPRRDPLLLQRRSRFLLQRRHILGEALSQGAHEARFADHFYGGEPDTEG